MPLRFECPHCSARLSAGPELYHTVTECPECTKQFMVPTSGDIKLPEDVVKFVCPHCRRKLSATPTQYGTGMPCPHLDCGKPVEVPDPAGDDLKGLYD